MLLEPRDPLDLSNCRARGQELTRHWQAEVLYDTVMQELSESLSYDLQDDVASNCWVGVGVDGLGRSVDSLDELECVIRAWSASHAFGEGIPLGVSDEVQKMVMFLLEIASLFPACVMDIRYTQTGNFRLVHFGLLQV